MITGQQPTASFGVVFAFCLGLVLVAFVPGLRLGHAAESSER